MLVVRGLVFVPHPRFRMVDTAAVSVVGGSSKWRADGGISPVGSSALSAPVEN
jgi:hypothetical protein